MKEEFFRAKDFPYIIVSKGKYIGSHSLPRFIGEPLRDFSKSTATKWSGAAREKIFLKKVLSFSEKDWIGGIDLL
jgi:hypothetical protein